MIYIDETLRRLVATLAGQPDVHIPVLVGLDVTSSHLTLRFRHPTDLPEPWEGVDGDDNQVWRIARTVGADLIGPLEQDSPPPWPQLVCLGADQHGWRLVNLEALGVVSLTGDPTFAADLARYLATELAVTPWARDVEIDCLAICPELPALAPDRLRYHDGPDVISNRVASAIDIADRLEQGNTSLETARVTFADDELWGSHLIVSTAGDTGRLPVLTQLVKDQTGCTATSVVLVNSPGPALGLEMHVTDTGRLQVPALGLDLVVNGLTEDEARGCVAVLVAGESAQEEPMPTDEGGADGWTQLCDAAGSIRDDLTVPRTDGAAEGSSILPEPNDTYVAQTANTEHDLEVLAPHVPDVVRDRIEAVDPTLDSDLDQWWSSTCDRPRLHVLGPLKVRVGATGEPGRPAARIAFYTEIVAYLATRPSGATTQDVAEALAVTENRVPKDLSIVRAWLGVDNQTGQPFLPAATRSPQAQERGVGLYLIPRLLCDADLFRRLRLRGEARGGAEGIQDLSRALRLVTGTPYDAMRSRGGLWLTDNRPDRYLLCGIVDVAHIICTSALTRGDIEQARAATQLACLVAPDDAGPQLDWAAVEARAGRATEAAEIARRLVHWRDNAGDRPDPSERTEQILRTHPWLDDQSK